MQTRYSHMIMTSRTALSPTGEYSQMAPPSDYVVMVSLMGFALTVKGASGVQGGRGFPWLVGSDRADGIQVGRFQNFQVQ